MECRETSSLISLKSCETEYEQVCVVSEFSEVPQNRIFYLNMWFLCNEHALKYPEIHSESCDFLDASDIDECMVRWTQGYFSRKQAANSSLHLKLHDCQTEQDHGVASKRFVAISVV